MIRNVFFYVFLFLAIISCKKDDPALYVVIEGMVLNAETTQPVTDAKIEVITNNTSHKASTDETGYFSLGKYTIGDYTIIISKEGFATQTKQVYAANNLSGGGVNGYEVVKSVVCSLVPATDNAELTVYRKFEDGEVIAATSFPYVISTGDINSTIEGTTDENGRISLNNVPQIFTVSIDHELNGIRYKISSRIDIRRYNYIVVYGYYAEANLGIASANILDWDGKSLENFPVDGTISLQFTVPVDTVNSNIDLLEEAWFSVYFTHHWSNNNMKLDITPSATLKAGTLYSVNLELWNASGMQGYNNAVDFVTAK